MKLHLEILEDGSLFVDFKGQADILTAALTLAAERDKVLTLGIHEAAKWLRDNKNNNLVIN
jgi:hypothetical protein